MSIFFIKTSNLNFVYKEPILTLYYINNKGIAIGIRYFYHITKKNNFTLISYSNDYNYLMQRNKLFSTK